MDEPAYKLDDLRRIGSMWIEKIRASEKRDQKWIDEAKKAEDIYLMDDEETDEALPSFNILHSNIETIVPSIFNSSPAPDIRPRHNNRDPVAKVVSDIIERAISTQIDDSAMDSEIEGSAQDAFMAGRGIVRLRFDADEVPAQMGVQLVIDPVTGEPVEQEVEIAPARLVNERISYETVSWRDYREGPAKRWDAVPWVAFRHEITNSERERLEQPEIAQAKGDEYQVDEDKDCCVWEIWCRETGRVYFVVDESAEVLSIADDPLGLSGFFPNAQPVQPITGTGKRCPVCPYSVYKKLAQELDAATRRINAVMKGLKVRGLIAGDAEVVELLANVGDNELVPVPNIEGLVAAGGLDKAIMWWPVDQAIAVLQQLYVQREQTKAAIYEITGISDIIRGQGVASETATAQQIKTEWGALRVKKMQRLIERQVRELFVMTAELISKHFSYETLQQISGIQIDEQAAQLLQAPLDHYRIDVESDSTVRADMTKSRTEMAEFLQGTAQFFSTMQPVVASAPQAAGPLVKMYASFARQFNLGRAGEDAIEEFAQMAEQQAQGPQEPSPEQQAQQAEMQMKAQELEQRFAMEAQKFQHEQSIDERRLQLDAQAKQRELEISAFKAGLERDKVQIDEARAEVDAAAKAAEIEMEMEQERPVKVGND